MLSPARARLRMLSVSAAWPELTPERRDAALERGDALLEDVRRRVHDPGVDVPELLEPEQAGGVGRVVEDVAGRGVDRHGAGVRRRVRLLPAVQGAGLRAERGRIESVMGGPPWGRSVSRSRWPWEGRCLAVTRRVVGGQTKRPRLRHGVRGPGTVSVVPLLRQCVARDLRPHPPTAGPPAHTHVRNGSWSSLGHGGGGASRRQPAPPNRNLVRRCRDVDAPVAG